MATLSSVLNLASNIVIGEYVPVIYGNFNTSQISYAGVSSPPSTLSNGKFVRAGLVYLQSQYPALFAVIGQSTGGLSYNTSTEFYVPLPYSDSVTTSLAAFPSSKWTQLLSTSANQSVVINTNSVPVGHLSAQDTTYNVSKIGRAGIVYYVRATA